MPLFKRKEKVSNKQQSSPPNPKGKKSALPPVAPLSPAADISTSTVGTDWRDENTTDVYCMVEDEWDWVIQEIANNTSNMTIINDYEKLPLSEMNAKQNGINSNNGNSSVDISNSSTTSMRRSSRRNQNRDPSKLKCNLRIEIMEKQQQQPSNPNDVIYAYHGISAAFDGLEDKDELVRTIQHCRCQHLNISPPSILINWDVTHDECINVVGKSMPSLTSSSNVNIANNNEFFAVLKEPLGSQGTGIFFVQTAEEVHDIVSKQRQKVQAEPQFLDKLIEEKGRIPSWVLQAEVSPCLLIEGKYKFHLRSYVVVSENPPDSDSNTIFDIHIYNRHEVRIAKVPFDEEGPSTRNRNAHITNSAFTETNELKLLSQVHDLVDRDIGTHVENFLAQTFGEHLVPDMTRRVINATKAEMRNNNNGNNSINNNNMIRKYAIAGVDLMVGQDNRIYLIEVNINPKPAPVETLDSVFQSHLVGLMRDTINIVSGKGSKNFLNTDHILSNMMMNSNKRNTRQ